LGGCSPPEHPLLNPGAKGANQMPKITKPTTRRFEYPDDPYNGFVTIKHLSPGETAEISDQAFKREINYKSGKGKKDGYAPDVKLKEDLRLYTNLNIEKAVVGWGNFFDDNDEQISCTKETKEKAIDEIDGFVEFISECRETLAADIAKEKADQLKNLKASVPNSVKETAKDAEAPTNGMPS
jgi:hypothetical protein